VIRRDGFWQPQASACVAYRVTARSEIERALCFLHRPARHAVRVDHRRPDIGMAEQRLDGADIVVRLQEMGGSLSACGS
jgi:hypothetical protein